jgi:hypothetical protein
MGADTGAPGAGRTEYGATSVLLTAFCVKSRRARPFRSRFAHSQLTMSGTSRPMASDSCSTHIRVCSKV